MESNIFLAKRPASPPKTQYAFELLEKLQDRFNEKALEGGEGFLQAIHDVGPLLHNLEVELEGSKAELDDGNGKVEDLQMQVDKLSLFFDNEARKNIEKEKAMLALAISGLQSHIKNGKKSQTKMTQESEKLELELNRVRAALQDSDMQCRLLREKLDQELKEKDDIQQTFDLSWKELTEVESGLFESRDRFKDVKKNAARERTEMAETRRALEASLKATEAETEKLKEKNARKRIAKADLTEKVKDLSAKVADIEQKNSVVEKTRHKMEAQVGEIKDRLSASSLEVRQLKKVRNDLRAEYARIESDIKTKREEHEKRYEAMILKYEETVRKNVSLMTLGEELKQEIENWKSKLSDDESTGKKLEAEKIRLEKQLQIQIVECKRLAEKNARLKSEISSERKFHKAREQSLSQMIETLTKQMSQERFTRRSLEEQAAREQTRFSKTKTELNSQLSAAKADIETLTKEITTLNGKLHHMRATIADREQSIEKIKVEIQTLEETKETTKRELEGKIAIVHGDIQRFEGEITTLTARILVQDKSIGDLRSRVSFRREEVEGMHRVEKEITATNEVLTVKKEELTVTLEEAMNHQQFVAREIGSFRSVTAQKNADHRKDIETLTQELRNVNDRMKLTLERSQSSSTRAKVLREEEAPIRAAISDALEKRVDAESRLRDTRKMVIMEKRVREEVQNQLWLCEERNRKDLAAFVETRVENANQLASITRRLEGEIVGMDGFVQNTVLPSVTGPTNGVASGSPL